MIVDRKFNVNEEIKKFKKFKKIEDYYLFFNDDVVYLGGRRLINLNKLTNLLITFNKDILNEKDLNELKNEGYQLNDEIYIVSILTVDNLKKYQYEDILNLISFYFVDSAAALEFTYLLSEIIDIIKRKGKFDLNEFEEKIIRRKDV